MDDHNEHWYLCSVFWLREKHFNRVLPPITEHDGMTITHMEMS